MGNAGVLPNEVRDGEMRTPLWDGLGVLPLGTRAGTGGTHGRMYGVQIGTHRIRF